VKAKRKTCHTKEKKQQFGKRRKSEKRAKQRKRSSKLQNEEEKKIVERAKTVAAMRSNLLLRFLLPVLLLVCVNDSGVEALPGRKDRRKNTDSSGLFDNNKNKNIFNNNNQVKGENFHGTRCCNRESHPRLLHLQLQH
jgi:hypothetical protein